MKCNLKTLALTIALVSSSAAHPVENRPNTLCCILAIVSGAIGGYIFTKLSKSVEAMTRRIKQEKFDTSDIAILMKDYEQRKEQPNLGNLLGRVSVLEQASLSYATHIQELQGKSNSYRDALATHKNHLLMHTQSLDRNYNEIAWHSNILLALRDFVDATAQRYSRFSVETNSDGSYKLICSPEDEEKYSTIVKEIAEKFNAKIGEEKRSL